MNRYSLKFISFYDTWIPTRPYLIISKDTLRSILYDDVISFEKRSKCITRISGTPDRRKKLRSIKKRKNYKVTISKVKAKLNFSKRRWRYTIPFAGNDIGYRSYGLRVEIR